MKVLTGKEYGELFSEPVDDDCLSYPVNMTEASDIILPNRTQKSHKYSYGRALIIAGSSEYSGAPALAANACERSGAGLTRLMVPESIHTCSDAKRKQDKRDKEQGHSGSLTQHKAAFRIEG